MCHNTVLRLTAKASWKINNVLSACVILPWYDILQVDTLVWCFWVFLYDLLYSAIVFCSLMGFRTFGKNHFLTETFGDIILPVTWTFCDINFWWHRHSVTLTEVCVVFWLGVTNIAFSSVPVAHFNQPLRSVNFSWGDVRVTKNICYQMYLSP